MPLCARLVSLTIPQLFGLSVVSKRTFTFQDDNGPVHGFANPGPLHQQIVESLANDYNAVSLLRGL